jgi:hypothetical protein
MAGGGRFRRAAPAIGLIFLSPWVGEFLLGSSPIQHLPAALVLLLPLYGGGALLIREIARRFGRSYPAIVLLGAAYGVIEAGLLDQSMFNPAFLDEGSGSGLAERINSALGYIVGHAVWSITIPIAVIELMAPGRSAVPWLGRKGLAAAAVLYGIGCATVFSFIYAEYKFLAEPWQLAGAAAAAGLLIAAAFAVGRGVQEPASAPAGTGASRSGVRPWLVGIGAFLVSSAFVARPEKSWAGLIGGVLLLAAAWFVVRRSARSRWWSIRHRLALVSGTLLTYAWLGFFVTWMLWPEDRIAWFGNVLFALMAIALAAAMARRTRTAENGASGAAGGTGRTGATGPPSPSCVKEERQNHGA